jgi:hypothetical protein
MIDTTARLAVVPSRPVTLQVLLAVGLLGLGLSSHRAGSIV